MVGQFLTALQNDGALCDDAVEPDATRVDTLPPFFAARMRVTLAVEIEHTHARLIAANAISVDPTVVQIAISARCRQSPIDLYLSIK